MNSQTIKQKLTSKMGKDVVWTFSVQIAIMLCAFVINKLLASRLSIDDFGQYNLIKRSVQVLSFLMLAGVGITLPRYIPVYRNSDPPKSIKPLMEAAMIYIIGVTLVVCLVCLLFLGKMQEVIIGEGEHPDLLVIALGYAFVLALAQVAYAYYRGVGDFKWYNGAQLGVQLAIIVPLVLIQVLTATYVFSSWLVITTVIVCFYFGRELWRVRDGFALATGSSIKQELRTIVKYSSGRMVADFFLFSLAAFPLVYISKEMGLGATAYYSVGITFVTMVTPVFSFMGIILLPYVAECIAKHELSTANRLINRLMLGYLGASAAAILSLVLFTEFLTRLLFAESYVVASDITRIMLLAILPQAIYLLYRNPIDAISVIPYNTIILGLCLTVMVVSFSFCSTLTQFAWAYLGVSTLQGLLSFLTWQTVKKRTS